LTAQLRCDIAYDLWKNARQEEEAGTTVEGHMKVDEIDAMRNRVPLSEQAELVIHEAIVPSETLYPQLMGVVETDIRLCHGVASLAPCCYDDTCSCEGSHCHDLHGIKEGEALKLSWTKSNFACGKNLPKCYGPTGPSTECPDGIFPTNYMEQDLNQTSMGAAAGEPSCFPASSTVFTEDGPLTLSAVQQRGGATIDTSADFQSLRTDRWLWDVHASMGAEQATVEAEFLSISHLASSQPLRISPNHFLFMSKSNGDPQMLPARDLSIGDTVFARNFNKSGELMPSTVTNIETVTDLGIYAPFTWSGRLLVDDVLVSNYAVFSTTFEKTQQEHAWLPWERLMNLFNPFRYYYGVVLKAFELKYPSWIQPQGTASDVVLLVWRLADLFIVTPLSVLARVVELIEWPPLKERTSTGTHEICEGRH